MIINCGLFAGEFDQNVIFSGVMEFPSLCFTQL